jgi:hypothetical protein
MASQQSLNKVYEILLNAIPLKDESKVELQQT